MIRSKKTRGDLSVKRTNFLRTATCLGGKLTTEENWDTARYPRHPNFDAKASTHIFHAAP